MYTHLKNNQFTVTNSRADLQQTPTVEKHAHTPRLFTVLYTLTKVVYCAIYSTLKAAPVAEWLSSLTSVLLIIRSSHRCGFAPRTGHEFICETSHVLLAGVSGGFSPGTPVFAPPTD